MGGVKCLLANVQQRNFSAPSGWFLGERQRGTGRGISRPRNRIHGRGPGIWTDFIDHGYAIGHISGCHINPAVSLGLFAGKRFPGAELLPYIIAQVAGGACGSAVLYVIAKR